MTAAEKLSLPRQLAPNEDYYAIDAIGSTVVREALRSLAHAQIALTTKIEPTPAMIRGTRMHTAILEQDKLANYHVGAVDRRTKEGKAKAAELAEKGLEVISEDEYAQIVGVVNSVYSHPAAAAELEGGEAEVGFVMVDDLTGLDVKIKPDYMRRDEGVLVDVKTTSDASFRTIQRLIANRNIHVQAAYYLDFATYATGIEFDTFRLVVCEVEPPYAVSVFELDFGTIEKGRELYRHGLNLLAEAKRLDRWPAYSDLIQAINLPAWAFAEGDLV